MPDIIRVDDLTKSFAGHIAVQALSLRIQPGEIFGFLGPNGSGKTTTIRMLCGLLTPDAGRGHCLGYDIIKQADKIRHEIGYMTQRFSLYEDLTVEENLDFIARVYQVVHRHKRIEESMQILSLTARRAQLAGELSGGWKQRLALCAALLHEPRLLLLDEPTAGVDPIARRQFWDTIHELAATRGMTFLVSTHYMDEAERCSQLACLLDGKLLVSDTPQGIIKHAKLIVWSAQGKGLAQVADEMRRLPGVEQVNVLGDRIHVCGHHAALLLRSTQTVLTLQWQSVTPNLEEALISLMQTRDTSHGSKLA